MWKRGWLKDEGEGTVTHKKEAKQYMGTATDQRNTREARQRGKCKGIITQGRKAKCGGAHVQDKIVQDFKNTNKIRYKPPTTHMTNKAASDNNKTMQNAAARAKLPQQTKQTKCRKKQTVETQAER